MTSRYDDLKKALDGVEVGDSARELAELYNKSKRLLSWSTVTVTAAAVNSG